MRRAKDARSTRQRKLDTSPKSLHEVPTRASQHLAVPKPRPQPCGPIRRTLVLQLFDHSKARMPSSIRSRREGRIGFEATLRCPGRRARKSFPLVRSSVMGTLFFPCLNKNSCRPRAANDSFSPVTHVQPTTRSSITWSLKLRESKAKSRLPNQPSMSLVRYPS